MRTGISTFSFVGSDKNAGKTTALNFVYKKMHAEGVQNLIVSSIGINGESYDSLEVHPKPEITINAGDFFITEVHHLKGSTGLYEIKHLYSPPHFRKNFVLGKTLVNLPLILEGPNDKAGLQMIKNNLKTRFKNATLLIDGSIDRQFVAHPGISDEFYFSVLLTDRKQQRKKLAALLQPLNLKVISKNEFKFISRHIDENTKSLLFDKDGKIIHKGTEIPFCDSKLLDKLGHEKKSKLTLYLGGALSRTLYGNLSHMSNLNIILNNFTLYPGMDIMNGETIPNNIKLFHPVKVRAIFIQNAASPTSGGTIHIPALPDNIPVYNIFREDTIEIGI